MKKPHRISDYSDRGTKDFLNIGIISSKHSGSNNSNTINYTKMQAKLIPGKSVPVPSFQIKKGASDNVPTEQTSYHMETSKNDDKNELRIGRNQAFVLPNKKGSSNEYSNSYTLQKKKSDTTNNSFRNFISNESLNQRISDGNASPAKPIQSTKKKPVFTSLISGYHA